MNVFHTYVSLHVVENVYKLFILWSMTERCILHGIVMIIRWLSKLFGAEGNSDMTRCFGCLILASREVYSVVLTPPREIMEVNPYWWNTKESWLVTNIPKLSTSGFEIYSDEIRNLPGGVSVTLYERHILSKSTRWQDYILHWTANTIKLWSTTKL